MKRKKKQPSSPYRSHTADVVPVVTALNQYRSESDSDSSQQETIYMSESAVSASFDAYYAKQNHDRKKRSVQQFHRKQQKRTAAGAIKNSKGRKPKNITRKISAKGGTFRVVGILISALLLVLLLFFLCVAPLIMIFASGGETEETEKTDFFAAETENPDMIGKDSEQV